MAVSMVKFIDGCLELRTSIRAAVSGGGGGGGGLNVFASRGPGGSHCHANSLFIQLTIKLDCKAGPLLLVPGVYLISCSFFN